ncbi:MAG: DASS family sodium-coupled anion symporter [bacterium]|nr:DASS family sodium-coupled anion symporter [bacterium]
MTLTRISSIIFSLIVIVLIWLLPVPDGVRVDAWRLFAIFMGTLSLIVTGALPMGASTLVGLTLAVVTNVLSFSMAFSGYQNSVVWLVLIAFFISEGFLITGLGRRISYLFVSILGKKTLGLGYGLSLAELILAPVIPSVTARSGAIIYPIAKSLSHSFDSYAEDDSRKRLGTYLILVAFHSAPITGAMFLTAMAANPLIAGLALEANIQITWSGWALYALVPGLVSLLFLPLLIFWLSPPGVKQTPNAPAIAKTALAQMGPMSKNEWLMLFTFVALLILWVFGSTFNISAVVAALLGLVFLLLAGVIKWNNLLAMSSAWDTFIWFGAFVALAEGLNKLGITVWFGEQAAQRLSSLPWMLAVSLLLLLYFYSHYFFASSTAQVGALYLPFLLVALNLGAPPLIIALIFAYASNLFGGLTQYGFGSAPILFGSGFVSLREWLRVGFIVSTINLVIWLIVGAGWWYWLESF